MTVSDASLEPHLTNHLTCVFKPIQKQEKVLKILLYFLHSDVDLRHRLCLVRVRGTHKYELFGGPSQSFSLPITLYSQPPTDFQLFLFVSFDEMSQAPSDSVPPQESTAPASTSEPPPAALTGQASAEPSTASASAPPAGGDPPAQNMWGMPARPSKEAVRRPCVGLSVHVMRVYKDINNAYCREKRLRGPNRHHNDGYDDREGHYVVIGGEEIMERYTVQEVLGKGSFGTVVRAFDEKYSEPVAIKISRTGQYFYNQGKLEVDILLKLNNRPQLEDLVVRIRKVFVWRGHLCLVFELLSFNLYQLLKCTRYNGVSLDLTRKFCYQLLQVLRALEMHRPPIIHCDLKPENVLLRDQNRSGIRVIDFGSACYYSPVPRHKYIQSRFYRSPEVILELPYTTAIDRWSLGCMLVELHTGNALFPGKTEHEQLVNFTSVLGPLPDEMIAKSPKRDKFFVEVNGSFQLKPCTTAARHDDFAKLSDIIGVKTGGPRGSRKGQAGHEEAAYQTFLDFVTRLLHYDPAKRLGCDEAFTHPFLEPLIVFEQQYLAQREQAQKDREAAIASGKEPPASTAPQQSANTAGITKPTPSKDKNDGSPRGGASS